MKTQCRTHAAAVIETTSRLGGGECVECRRERQRNPRYVLSRRARIRESANQRDLATIKELIAKWQG